MRNELGLFKINNVENKKPWDGIGFDVSFKYMW